MSKEYHLTPEKIGHAILEVRKSRGLTQKVVSQRSGLTINYISLVENGRRGAITIGSLNKFGRAYDLPPVFILFLADDNDSKFCNGCRGAVRAYLRNDSETAFAILGDLDKRMKSGEVKGFFD